VPVRVCDFRLFSLYSESLRCGKGGSDLPEFMYTHIYSLQSGASAFHIILFPREYLLLQRDRFGLLWRMSFFFFFFFFPFSFQGCFYDGADCK